jgi:acetylglutamate kinase
MTRSHPATEAWASTAHTLSQALPFFQRYVGSTVVIKLGGHAMGSGEAMRSFARDIVLMSYVGVNPVIVHGGGPTIDAVLEAQGVRSRFIRGKRVTDAATIEVVEMVLSGLIGKRIVQAIQSEGGVAVGISGKDARLMVCEQTDPALGFVGTPVECNPGFLQSLKDSRTIPVIAPIGTGRDGETFNVNGDTAAGAIAGSLKADRLLLLTDVAGVKGDDGEVIPEILPEEIRALIDSGTIVGGMIPKTETALAAIEEGVRAVVILDGRAPHACLLELYTQAGAGTLIRSRR